MATANPARRARRGAVAGALVTLVFASTASAGDEAAAQALFLQAREAMGKGDFAKACPMLEESYRLVPGVGTKFNLGDCYEHLGLTASAWASFRDAAASSKLAGQKDRESAATERANRLSGKLCRLTIDVAPQSGITVTRDGDAVGPGQWGISVPVDPGSHVVAAKAPGKTPWSTSLSTIGCPQDTKIDVPLLPSAEEAPAAPPPTEVHPKNDAFPKPPPPRSSPTRTVVTVTSLGLGAAGVALGSFFGLRAMSLRDQSNEAGRCNAKNQCTDEGKDLRNDSRAFGTGATISFIAAGALLVLGAVLWLTDSPSPRAR